MPLVDYERLFGCFDGRRCRLAETVIDDIGEWLVSQLNELERSEAVWLERLAEFDLHGEWADDGHACCGSWMAWRLKMARSTAFEKLQVAHQLRRRPMIAQAFGEGRISYSAVRALCRIDHPDPDVDTALVLVAESGTVADVERAVRFYQLHADQERPPTDPYNSQTVRSRNNLDGTATLSITLPELDVEELETILQAFLDRADAEPPATPAHKSADADSGSDSPRWTWEAVDESAAADWTGQQLASADEPSPGARRAQAIMDMARVAFANIDRPQAVGADRYMLHLVVHEEHTQTVDGTPVEECVADRIACDASKIVHVAGHSGEPLALGRRTRDWSLAQRRAIMVRDGGTCRWPGCTHHHYIDIHHHQWWSNGGRTDIDNGYAACGYHHHLIHSAGYTVEGDPNDELTFHRPNGMVIGTTAPRRRALELWRGGVGRGTRR